MGLMRQSNQNFRQSKLELLANSPLSHQTDLPQHIRNSPQRLQLAHLQTFMSLLKWFQAHYVYRLKGAPITNTIDYKCTSSLTKKHTGHYILPYDHGLRRSNFAQTEDSVILSLPLYITLIPKFQSQQNDHTIIDKFRIVVIDNSPFSKLIRRTRRILSLL